MAIVREELDEKFREFRRYMTYKRCDKLETAYDDGSILRDDVLRSASAFIEFCCTGKVTDDDGNELEA